MSLKDKQLSNPFSTGGGGLNFETRVQALFAVLMLTGGEAPCLPPWPIKKIKLQGKYAGFNTDDLIVYVIEPNSDREAKLLAQVKHSISITSENTIFSDVIQSAWKDFENPEFFTPETDVFALITGPLSAMDIDNVRTILDWARHSEDAGDFIMKVNELKFSSDAKRAKLAAFRAQLKKANNGIDVTDEQLFKFLKSFYILGYDFDCSAGTILSLLHSLIGQYSTENAQLLWSRVVCEVQSANQNAGTLSIETIPQDLRDAFKERIIQTIPATFVRKMYTPIDTDWSQIEYATELALAMLLGSWNESSDSDKIVIEKLTGCTYTEWIYKIRSILLKPGTMLLHKNGKWNISERGNAWHELGSRLFDSHLEKLKGIAVSVLRESDPQFELPAEERFAASIYGKTLPHSQSLRKGLAESLALLGSRPKALKSCSSIKTETTAILAVKEILTDADWALWSSLNDLLPLLAEAAPSAFLDAVEASLNCKDCPFDKLFAQEGTWITGGNYLTGLLWALETLAWHADYLIRVTILLGELATHDPGGNWINRPSNSLSTIFLPWLPQTTAPIAKRLIAIETLQKELPDIAWKLLLDLLPNTNKVSSGSHKPAWRDFISEEQAGRVTHQEYWEQVTSYTDLAINAAKKDLSKLVNLVKYVYVLPTPASEKLLTLLDTDEVIGMTEAERFPLWVKLVGLVSKHRKFSGAEWAMNTEQVNKIEEVSKKLEPSTPIFRYQRLFSIREFDLYEGEDNWEEQDKKLNIRREKAIIEIFAKGGIDSVLEFVYLVESPSRVGIAFGTTATDDVDLLILPDLLKNDKKALEQFTGGFVLGRYISRGWRWVDQTDFLHWKPTQIGQLLTYLPFKPETWERATRLLGKDETPYWTNISANPWEAEDKLELAIDKLVNHGRPYAAIDCLSIALHDKRTMDCTQAVKVLIAALNSSESVHTMDQYHVIEVIKALQENPNTNPDDLFRVEWAYLPLLDRDQGASPKLLEKRLADDPDFFCEVIRTVFRSKNEEQPIKELTEQANNIATNAYRLLDHWCTPPGSLEDGSFNGDVLDAWIVEVKRLCGESGHLSVALSTAGKVLIYAPPDPSGLWIHHSVAKILNSKETSDMRSGFRTQLFNSRGVHWVDPTGNPERELADKYRKQADDLEAHGYHRFAETLRELAASYEREAERIVQREN